MTSKPFVLGEEMEALTLTAKEFGQRPSTLLDIRDPTLALDFDLAAMSILVRLKAEAREEA